MGADVCNVTESPHNAGVRVTDRVTLEAGTGVGPYGRTASGRAVLAHGLSRRWSLVGVAGLTTRWRTDTEYGGWEEDGYGGHSVWREQEFRATGPTLQVGLEYEGPGGFRYGARAGWQGGTHRNDACRGRDCQLSLELVRVGYGF